MRSAATIAAFAGLANAAAYYPPADVSAVSSAPAPDVTEYSTLLVTVTSCAPEVSDCPADSTVVESSVVPLTTSTVFETRVYTVSHCGPEVVDCPYASGGVETVYETIAVSTTVCPVTEEYPAPTTTAGEGEETYPPVSPPTKSAPAPEESKPAYPPTPEESKPVYPPTPEESTAAYPPKPTGYPPIPTKPTEEETCPTVSVKTIVYSTEVTTVVPTVITKYETATLQVPCPEATTPGKPSDVPVPPPHYPSGNGTIPAVPSGTAPVEASGAAGLSGSVLVAALAAVAAFAFA